MHATVSVRCRFIIIFYYLFLFFENSVYRSNPSISHFHRFLFFFLSAFTTITHSFLAIQFHFSLKSYVFTRFILELKKKLGLNSNFPFSFRLFLFYFHSNISLLSSRFHFVPSFLCFFLLYHFFSSSTVIILSSLSSAILKVLAFYFLIFLFSKLFFFTHFYFLFSLSFYYIFPISDWCTFV